MREKCNFHSVIYEELLGKIITKIEGAEEGSDEIRFITDDGHGITSLQSKDT